MAGPSEKRQKEKESTFTMKGDLHPRDAPIVADMQRLSVKEMADVIDQVIKQKKDPNMTKQVMSYLNWQRTIPGFSAGGPASQNVRRDPALTTGWKDMTEDFSSLPMMLNGNSIPGFLAADAEFIMDRRTKQKVIVSFSAVSIPEHRGQPEPKIHLIVNPDKGGEKFQEHHFDVRFHGIGRDTWKMHIPESSFVDILTAFAEIPGFFLFWDKTNDTKALMNTFSRTGVCSDQVVNKLVDVQFPIQEILLKFAPHRRRGERLSLSDALDIFRELVANEATTNPELVVYTKRILGQIRVGAQTGRKSSLWDATAVAILYNYFASRLPTIANMQAGVIHL